MSLKEMSSMDGSRSEYRVIPKVKMTATADEFAVWRKRAEVQLAAKNVHHVTAHPVAYGTVEQRSASQGRPRFLLSHVREETAAFFIAMMDEPDADEA